MLHATALASAACILPPDQQVTEYPLTDGGHVGLFDRKEKPRADFSNVQSGSSTRPDASAEPAARADRRYTVRSGDTLSGIAKREYGDAGRWKLIFEANRDKIDNPDLIHPGQELTIPPAEGGGG